MLGEREAIRQAAEATSHFGKLSEFQLSVEGNHVYLLFTYTTGDAAGQNMATIATEAAVNWIKANTPVKPRTAYIEANFKETELTTVRVGQPAEVALEPPAFSESPGSPRSTSPRACARRPRCRC